MRTSQVVITRPEPECSDLAAILAQKGLRVIKLPAFEFEAREPALPGTPWSSAPRLAIYTSPRAVEFGVGQLRESSNSDLIIAAMGSATAAALQSHGFKVDLLPETGVDSEALLRNPLFEDKAGSAVIFSAEGGRDALRKGLQAKGWDVNMAWVYQRRLLEPSPEQVAALEASVPLVSIWTSGAAMDFMRQQLQGRAWDNILAGAMVVISPRLSRKAEAMGAENILLAAGPGNEELSQCAFTASG